METIHIEPFVRFSKRHSRLTGLSSKECYRQGAGTTYRVINDTLVTYQWRVIMNDADQLMIRVVKIVSTPNQTCSNTTPEGE